MKSIHKDKKKKTVRDRQCTHKKKERESERLETSMQECRETKPQTETKTKINTGEQQTVRHTNA